MARMGALGIGLSLIFGGFFLLLLAELYYVFFWKRRSLWNRRINSVAADCIERAEGRRVAGSRPVADAEFVAKLFPIRSEVAGSNNSLYMQGVFGGPRLLFTIKEETKEDMEYEESVLRWEKNSGSQNKKNKKKISSPKIYSESPSPARPLQQQQNPPPQRQFAYSIGLIQQNRPQKMSAESPKQQSARCNPSENSSCPFPNGSFPCSPPLLPAFISPPSWRSSSSSSSSSSSLSASSMLSPPWHKSEPQCAERDSNSGSANSSRNFVCISNPVYEVSSRPFEDSGRAKFSAASTPFGTPVSSPSLLDQPCGSPPLSPPLTPIKVPLAPRSLPPACALPRMSGQFSGDSSSSCLFAKCSSPPL